MKTTEKKKVSDTLTERTVFLWVGILPIFIKPLTLGQIYEMGEHVAKIDGKDVGMKDRIVPSAEMLARYAEASIMQEVFLITAFRSRWKRWLFRRYILKRLTVRRMQKAIEVITNAYTANFFLTSIIFLHQTKPMTEPSQTTPLGQQWEE